MYGFNPTLGSDYFNKGSSNNSGSSNSDWKTDWNTVGDYSGLSGVPFGSFDYTSKNGKWKNAVNLASDWLGTGKNKYKSLAEREYPGMFAQQSKNSDQPNPFKVAPDITILPGHSTPPFTVAGGQSSGGGLGSTIGAAAGLAAGLLIPGAQPYTGELMALGGGIGGNIG